MTTDAITLINRIASTSRLSRREATTGEDVLHELGIDDIDRAGIAMAIEETFGHDLTDDEIERWVCVSDVARTMERVAA